MSAIGVDSPTRWLRKCADAGVRQFVVTTSQDATLDESKQRIIASLERYSKQVRHASTGRQALFA
jgi:hypothetical protein